MIPPKPSADFRDDLVTLLLGGDVSEVENSEVRQSLFWLITVGAMVLGSAIIGVTTLSYFHGREVLRELVRPFGEAALIAGFLAVTVDQYVKERLLKESSRDISKYLIGYNLPTEIQDQIHELMGTAIIRRNFEQRYTLERHSVNKLKLTVNAEYRLINCSGTQKEFIPRLEFEKHEDPTVLQFRCDSADRKAVDLKSGDQGLVEKESGVLSIALKKIKLQPQKSGLSYRVSCKYSRLVDTHDSDILSFVAPTIGVTLRAEHPEGISFAVGSATIETENRWEFQRLFLEGQHIHVRWFESDKQEGLQ
jgi:hypothetical protein